MNESIDAQKFDPRCVKCPRLSEALGELRQQFPTHANRPVDGFGASRYRLLIVGLAPGLHGANRTGRVFTGDSSGSLLFKCLHRRGIADQEDASSTDARVKLVKTRITNAVKCWPPQNRPTTNEIENCNPYLSFELGRLPRGGCVLALGGHAHTATLKALNLSRAKYPFAHGAIHRLGRITLLDSYHCSRLNVNTGRLTESMLQTVIDTAAHEAKLGLVDEG